jgi:plastocyanin
MRAFSLTVLASAALLAAGCGSSSSSSSSSGGNGSSSGAASTPAGAGETTSSDGQTAVQIKGFAFNPGKPTVKVGQKITWTNADPVAHNVVAKSGASFSSETLNQGDSFSYTPTKAGAIDYVCTFHPNMQATLTVTG